MKKDNNDRLSALLLTLLFSVAIVITLFYGKISWESVQVAKTTPPDLMMPEEEELFIEPELKELGEENAVKNSKPAPAVKGEPDPGPEDNAEIIEPAPKAEPKPKPTPPKPKLNTQKKESAVKAEEPDKTEKERKKATSTVANKFSPKNGSTEGTPEGATGAGGTGVGVSGNAHGRSFISCPKPDVALRHKTIVTVNVVIDAEGRVTEATAKGSADATIRRKCEAAARQARWSAKKGATSTRGSITFTLTPR